MPSSWGVFTYFTYSTHQFKFVLADLSFMAFIGRVIRTTTNNETMIQQRINECATLDNALEWNAQADQMVYCHELLNVFIRIDHSEDAINQLESRFEELLGRR